MKTKLNDVKADSLMHKLRKFAIANRANKLNWNDDMQRKYYIYYSYDIKLLMVDYAETERDFGVIYFDSEEIAQEAIDVFLDELVWYFTEYKDGL